MKLKFKVLILLITLILAIIFYFKLVLFNKEGLNLPKDSNNLYYQAYWGIIPIGEVIINVNNNELYNGNPAILIEAEAKTKGILEAIFGIKASIGSIISSDTLLPFLYRETIYRVDEKKEDKILYYNQIGNKLTTEDSIYRILPDTYDPLSVLMFLRNRDMKENDNIEINVNSNQSNYKVEVDVVTEFQNRKGNFIYLKGLSERRQGEKARHRVEFSLYVTKDSHIPVLIRFSTSLGPITLRLTNSY